MPSFQYPIKRVGDCIYEIGIVRKGMRVPVKIFANESLLRKMTSDRTLIQAMNVAHLKGILKHSIVLPDGHEGYGFPIGGVAAFDVEGGVVSPGGIGYDINCGVRLLRTDMLYDELKPRLKDLVDELFRSVPSGVGSRGRLSLSMGELDEVVRIGVRWALEHGYGWERDEEFCEEGGAMKGADPSKISQHAKKRGHEQLGTLGSGNHFLEVQKVDRIYDERAAREMGIFQEGQVTVLIHTGSRGFGHQICSDYLKVMERSMRKHGLDYIFSVDRELACAPLGSDEASDYLGAMFGGANFAWCNRQLITHWVRKSFEKVFKRDAESLGLNLVYDVAHNIAKFERHKVDGEVRDVIVHRKGATRAFPAGSELIPQAYRGIGQPVLLPGSMGTASWILLGNEKAMELSFGSTAHGAGRLMSRAEAKRRMSYNQVLGNLGRSGIYVRSMTRRGLVEETPEAYKDVDAVAEVSDRVGIATKVARLVPLGVVKG